MALSSAAARSTGCPPGSCPCSYRTEVLRCPFDVNTTFGFFFQTSTFRRVASPVFALLLLVNGFFNSLFAAEPADGANPRKLDPRLQQFFAAKERHGRSL